MKNPIEMKKEKYTIQVNYSEEAIEKKLMKFITPSGDEFEISANEMSTILMGQLNSELLAATFVETDRVHVVEVTRQMKMKLDRDFKKGEEIRMDYTHPYPIEFAIIEEGMKLAKINKDVPVFTLTKEFLDQVIEKSKAQEPERKKFINRFYDFFKNLRKN